jgi:hypothetical protein
MFLQLRGYRTARRRGTTAVNEPNGDDDNGLSTGGELNMAPDAGDALVEELRETREELQQTREELQHVREEIHELQESDRGAEAPQHATEAQPPGEDTGELDVGREP